MFILQILMKWGEYSSDVQFILQRSETQKTDNSLSTINNGINNNIKTPIEPQLQKQQQQSPQSNQKASQLSTGVPLTRNANLIQSNLGNAKIINNNLNNLNVNNNIINHNTNMNINNNNNNINNVNIDRKTDLVGIVKGVQKQNSSVLIPKSPPASPPSLTDGNESIASSSSASASVISSPQSTPQKPMVVEFNSADVRNSLDRKTNALRNAINLSNESLDESSNGGASPGDLFKNCPPHVTSNGALAPPPYRNPPQPRNSPPTIGPHSLNNSMAFAHHQKSDSLSSSNSGTVGSSGYRPSRSNQFDFLKEMTPPPLSRSKNGSFKGDLNCNVDGINDIINDNVLQNAQFRDLMQLIKYQRDKITSQQADITKVTRTCG